MAKKFALALALLLALVMVLAGCATEDYTKTPLTGDTSGEVTSNGGLAVIKGDYLYFVNGSQKSNANNNIFGKVQIGAIIRISLFNFEQAMMSANAYEVIGQNGEIVVPKMIYSANTTDKFLNGIHFYGDRIYYTTPDTTPDREGAAQYARLAVKSCKLDGTDTRHHYIFDKSEYTVAFAEISGKPYAAYVQNSKLYLIDLMQENAAPALIHDGVASVKYDDNGTVFFTDADNNIYSYLFGGAVKKIVENPTVEGDSKTGVTYTLNSISEGEAYFTMQSTYNVEVVGVYKVTAGGELTRLTYYVPSVYMGYNGKLLVYESANYSLNLYDPASKTSKMLVKEDESVTLTGIQEGCAVYVTDGKSKLISLTGDDSAVEVTETAVYANWAQLDLCGQYAFFIKSEAETQGYTMMAVDLLSSEKLTKVIIYGYFPSSES